MFASDDRQKLQATLDELHAQLRAGPRLDPATEQRLLLTILEIEGLLASSQERRIAERAHADQSLADRLSDMALDFEATHPTLSGTLGSIVNALARMGI